jgi:hypothetical protein
MSPLGGHQNLLECTLRMYENNLVIQMVLLMKVRE